MSKTQNWVAMGYIKGAFGVKGWVKVQPSTEYTDSLLDYDVWHLAKGQDSFDAEVIQGHVAGGELQVKFAHINDRDAAALLRGYTVYILRDDFAQTEDNEFYWTDLVGMAVQNRDNIILGEVVKLLETGAHDVLVIRGNYGEKLIPFVTHYIDQVDEVNRVITVDWGLDY